MMIFQNGVRSIKGKYILILIIIAVLCVPVFAQAIQATINSSGQSKLLSASDLQSILGQDSRLIKLVIYPESIDGDNKCVALYKQGKYNEVIQVCDAAIRRDPNYAEAWLYKAEALMALGRMKEGKSSLEKAIEMDPKSASAWVDIGTIFYMLGNDTISLQACEKAIEINPNSSMAWAIKGIALRNLGRNAESDVAFAKYEELNQH